MSHQKTFLTWLNDAYAMEQGLVETLEKHRDQSEDYPDIQANIEEHLEQTKHHAELVKGCIERLGGDVSTVKDAMANMMGTMQGMMTGMAKDTLVKNGIADYAAEHFEIASYTALKAAAEEMGDQDTVAVCDQIIPEEEAMAEWLSSHMPSAVKEFMAQKEMEHEGDQANYSDNPSGERARIGADADEA